MKITQYKNLVFAVGMLVSLGLAKTSHAASLMDCALTTGAGWNQGFLLTKQMGGAHYNCTDSDGKRYEMRFSGVGASLIAQNWEGFKVAFLGPKAPVSAKKDKAVFVGVRAAVSAGVGISSMAAINPRGLIVFIGVNAASIGLDASLIKITIAND